MPDPARTAALRWVAVVGLAAAECGLVAYLLGGRAEPAPVAGAAVAVAALLVLASRPGGPGPADWAAALDAAARRAEADRLAADLARLAVPPEAAGVLRRLAARGGGGYVMTDRLRQALRDLRRAGLVTVRSVGAIPAAGADLSVHVRVTAAGEQYAALRDRLDRAPSAGRP